MKRNVVPVALMTGPYVTHNYPHTILTQKDASEKKIESRSTENYAMIVAGYMPLGVTNEIICFEGENNSAADLFVKHHGRPNTLMYGSMGTYAHQALLAGFKVFFLNTRMPDATYPNIYLALNVEKMKGDNHELTIYGWMDSSDSHYYFASNKDDLPEGAMEDSEGANIKEIKLPRFDLQFKAFSVEDCKHGDLGYKKGSRGFEVAKFLKKSFKDTISKSSKTGIQDDETFHLPILGLFYRGAGSYGNVYRLKFTTSPNKVHDKYPEFIAEVTNQGEVEHKFNFALFDIDKYGVNMGFGDQAADACKLRFTSTNHTDTFRAYSLTRKDSNAIGPLVEAMEKKIKESLVAKIKEQFPSFEEESSESDLPLILEELADWKKIFAKPELGTAETWLSKTNPFEEKEFSTPQAVHFTPTPTEIPFINGTDGVLGDVIASGEFDWKQEVEYNHESIKVWEVLLNSFWSGTTDDALFDPKIVRDGIIIGDSYPLSVQQTIDDLVLYRGEEYNYDKTRPDFCFIRTPDEDVADMEGVYGWQRSFVNKKNMSVIPNIGRFRFTDPTTGAQVYMSGWFSYLGINGNLYQYLIKGVSDPFASGAWSYVNKAAQNSEELIPKGSKELTTLTNCDISYFQMQSSGIFKLGAEVAYNPGYTSVLKNFGAIVNNNRIKNITHNILFDNKIINPTAPNLSALEDLIKESIAPYTRIFNDRVTVSVKLSEHPEEINKNIIVAYVDVYADHFSTRNRCSVTIHDAAAL